jgi:hypothetical protein
MDANWQRGPLPRCSLHGAANVRALIGAASQSSGLEPDRVFPARPNTSRREIPRRRATQRQSRVGLMCVIAVARAVEALNDRRGRFFSVKLEERLVRDSRGASSMSTQSVICCRPCRGYGLIDHAGRRPFADRSSIYSSDLSCIRKTSC